MAYSDRKLGPAVSSSPSKGKEKAQSKPVNRKEVEAFTEKLLKKRDEQLEKIEEAFDKRMKKSSDKVSQRALGAWKSMKNRQLREVAAFYNTKIKAFEQRAGSGSQSRESLATELMKEAGQEAETRRVFLVSLLESKIEGEFATTEEVAAIDKAVKGLAAFEKQNPQLEELFKRITGKEKLKKTDYDEIIKILKPYDLMKQDATSSAAFEATTAGILVGSMSPKEREQLVKYFMESNRKAETSQLIDALLVMGLMEDHQATNLLKGTAYETDISKKVKDGHYKKERQRVAVAQESHIQKYRGIYNENIASRVVGKPLFGILAMVWGTTTFALNALVSYPNGKGPGRMKRIAAWAKGMAKNPYAWAGLAAAGGGAEVASTSIKTGGWIGAGPIARLLEKSEKKKEQMPKLEATSRQKLEEIRESGPKPLNAYLENGGFKTVQELRKKIIREKTKRIITIDELIKLETNAAQKQRLQQMKLIPTESEESINAKLTTVSEAAFILKIKTDEEFQKTYKKSEK